MKELSNYINEKLDINRVNLNSTFPINGKLHDMIEFLEENGFELAEKPFVEVKRWREIVDALDKKEGRCYVYSERFEIVRFADTSKPIDTLETNPIYTVSLTEGVIDRCALEGKQVGGFKNIDDKEFLKAINKRFGWK